MSHLKTTNIYVRAFDTDFVVSLAKDHYVSIEQALAWSKIEMIDTAIVRKVVQKWDEGELEIYNPNTPKLLCPPHKNRTVMVYDGTIKPDPLPEKYNEKTYYLKTTANA